MAELDRRLGKNELEHWRAYLSRRPPREVADWDRFAALIFWIVQLATPPDQRSTLPQMSDFRPDLSL